jgi:integrase
MIQSKSPKQSLWRQRVAESGFWHDSDPSKCLFRVAIWAKRSSPARDATPSNNWTFLVTELGKPFTASGFDNWFRDRCREAGLDGLSAHGLRKAAATRFAENGAAHELMAWFGWSKLEEAELYTRAANHKALAAGLVLKLGSRTRGGNRT